MKNVTNMMISMSSMMAIITTMLLLDSVPLTLGYVTQSNKKLSITLSATSMESSKSPFSKISSVLSDLLPDNKLSSSSSSRTILNPTEPESLFSKARTIINTDFGLQDPSLLDNDNFIWYGPSLYGKGLTKDDYLAASNFFNLRETFPDLDYRAHDFRIDSKDALTVRLSVRTVGTMRGDLRLRTDTIPANGKRMICPPEAISMTFDSKGDKLLKLCTGYCMDRLVGNTNGQCGVRAAATVAGIPPSEFDIYPPIVVFYRFFGRNIDPVDVDDSTKSNFIAPFPETVMIQLAKGVLAADNGASDPDLLSNSFTFCGPYVGPLKKDDFVKAFSNFNLKAAFTDLDEEYSNFRVDPFDPYRVWVDTRGSGTNTGSLAGKPPTGKTFQNPPEAASLTFDDDGFCTRLTAGVAMDPTLGNTGGLGGVYGIFYGIGSPLPDFVTRPIPEIVGRLKKSLLSPFTGIGVDDYGPSSSTATAVTTASSLLAKPQTTKSSKLPSPPKKPPATSQSPLEKMQQSSSTTSTPIKKTTPPPSKPKPPAPGSKEAIASAQKAMKAAKPRASINILGLDIPLGVAEEGKSVKSAAKKTTPQPPKPKPIVKKSAVIPPPKPIKTPKPGSKQAIAAAEKAMKTAKPRASINIFTMGGGGGGSSSSSNNQAKAIKTKAAPKPKPSPSTPTKKIIPTKQQVEKKKKALKEAEKVMKDASPRATISLFGIGKPTTDATATTTKPSTSKPVPSAATKSAANMPSLKNWGVNKDKSITGQVFGSSGFKNGSEITTSIISSGEFKAGSTVTTSSGSRYLLK